MEEITTTRGIRNRNPLNIRLSRYRWQGQTNSPTPSPSLPPMQGDREGLLGDVSFCTFTSMHYGFRAAIVLMRNYITRYKANTIERIITRWAPPSDGNRTDKYINDVCRLTGFAGRAPLAATDPRLKDIVWAMAQIESGPAILAYRDDLERGWALANLHHE